MPFVTIPQEVYEPLAKRAAALNMSVEQLIAPWLRHAAESCDNGHTAPASQEWQRNFDAWMAAVESRAHRYPPGFAMDDSRESVYEGMRRMTILLDANVILRLADPTSKSHAFAATAVSVLCANGNALHVVPQSVYEFWTVATRPIANNGRIVYCGMHEVANIEASFPLLDDKPNLFTEWKAIVASFMCHGKVAHDARYVAAMRTHGITRLLTFNVTDFSRYPGLTVLDAVGVAASGASSKTP